MSLITHIAFLLLLLPGCGTERSEPELSGNQLADGEELLDEEDVAAIANALAEQFGVDTSRTEKAEAYLRSWMPISRAEAAERLARELNSSFQSIPSPDDIEVSDHNEY